MRHSALKCVHEWFNRAAGPSVRRLIHSTWHLHNGCLPTQGFKAQQLFLRAPPQHSKQCARVHTCTKMVSCKQTQPTPQPCVADHKGRRSTITERAMESFQRCHVRGSHGSAEATTERTWSQSRAEKQTTKAAAALGRGKTFESRAMETRRVDTMTPPVVVVVAVP